MTTIVPRRVPRRVRLLSALLAALLGAGLLAIPPAAASGGGSAFAWGRNSDGQVGDGTTTERHTATAVNSALGNDVVEIAGGFFHSLARKADGTVWAWGDDSQNQLGTGSGDGSTSVPVQVLGLSNIIDVDAYGTQSLAVDQAGAVYHWGQSDTINAQTPQSVVLPANVVIVQVAAGLRHQLALDNNQQVYSWGVNCLGQLGTGSPTSNDGCATPGTTLTVPTLVPSLSNVVQVSAGEWHSAALVTTGATKSIYAWGYNAFGQLGNGNTTNQNTPQAAIEGPATPASGYDAIDAGDTTTLGLKGGGVFYAGSTFGQSSNVFAARSVGAGAVVSQVSAGSSNFALATDGTVYGWGSNLSGELGDGTTTGRSTPTPVSGLSNAIFVAAGVFTNYAITGVPRIDFDPTTLNFGTHAQGTTTALSTTVTNTGDAGLVISGASIDATEEFSKTADTCSGQTLAPNATCSVTVSYTPGDVGEDAGGLFFTSNAVNNAFVSLSGTGEAAPPTPVANLALDVLPRPSPLPGFTDDETPIGATEVPVDNVDPNAIPVGQVATPTLPVNRLPVNRLPVNRLPVNRLALGTFPVNRLPVNRLPVNRLPVNRLAATWFGQQLLYRFPITRPGGWAAILEAAGIDGTPENTTFAQLVGAGAPAIVGTDAQALKLNEFNLVLSPWANLSLFSVLLGDVRWSDIAGITQAELAAAGAECLGPDGMDTMVFEADLRGCALEKTSLGSRLLGDIQPPLASGRRALFLDLTIYDAVKDANSKLDGILLSSLADLDKVVDCAALAGGTCPAGLRLGDPAALPGLRKGDEGALYGRFFSLGSAIDGFRIMDLAPMFVPMTALPWAQYEPADISAAGYGAAANVRAYELEFDVLCGDSADLKARLVPHGGFRYVPGSGYLNSTESDLEPAMNADGSFQVALPGCTPSVESPPSRHLSWAFSMQSGFELGTFGLDVHVSSATATAELLNHAVLHVKETDQGSTPGTAGNAATGVLYLGQVAHRDDLDLRRFFAPAGKVLRIGVNVPDGQDLDIVLYGPQGFQAQAALVPGTPRKVAFGKLPIQDAGVGYDGGVVRPELGQEIHLIGGLPVAGVSAFRSSDSEFITVKTVDDPAEDGWYLQIGGHDGSHGPVAYTAIIDVDDPVPVPECTPTGRQFAHAGDGALVSVPAVGAPSPGDPADTLILLHGRRLAEVYGADSVTNATTGILKKVDDFVAAEPGGVKSRIVRLDAFTSVNDALADWDVAGNRCDPEAANEVVRAITDVIAAQRTAQVSNVVVVGSDEILPFARILDPTTDGNETGYASELLLDSDSGPAVASNNAAAGAAGEGYMLSDNPYGTIIPLDVFGTLVYLPQLSVGRIGETPADITAQFDQFRLSGGLADPRTASTDPRNVLETDYDFVTDGGDEIVSAFNSIVGAANVTRLTGETWDKGDVQGALLPGTGTPPVIAAINGHFNHHEMLSAAGNTSSTDDLFTSDLVNAYAPSLAKRIYFSVGCHFALNVANELGAGILSQSDLETRTPLFDQSPLNDWTEAFVRKGAAAAIGNTGYGLGDLTGVGYSEYLNARVASYLDGSRTIGEALRLAKTDYWLAMGGFAGEDLKVIQQAVLWGFPQFTLPGAVGASAAAAITPIQSVAPDPISGIAATTQMQVTPTFQSNTADGGRMYLSADDGTQNTTPYPVMPKVLAGFEAVSGKRPAFVAPLALTFQDQAILQAFSDATPDTDVGGAPAGSVAYPAVLQNITEAVDADGNPEYQGVIIPAQYFPGADINGQGVIRKFTTSNWVVFYGPGTGTITQPVVNSVDVTQVGGTTAIVAEVTDPAADVVRAWALVYRTGQTQTTRVELGEGAGGSWSGGIAATDVNRVEVFAVNANGGGASATFKGLGYPVTPTPDSPALPAPKSLQVKDGTLVAGWYKNSTTTGAPKAYVNDGTGAVDNGYQVSIDGGAPQNAPAAIVGDGFHAIQAVRVSDGQVIAGAIIVGVDNTAPEVFIMQPADGSTLLLNQSVAESYACVDAGSGIALNGCTDSNPGGNVDTSSIGSKAFTATATDVVGLTGAATSTYNVKFAAVTGFLPPVDSYDPALIVVNQATSKQTIPFKWTVADANGASVPTAGQGATYAWTKQNSCAAGDVVEPVPSDFISTPTSSPIYEPGSGKFIWNLRKGSPTGCFMFTLKLADGSALRALFSIK